MKWDTLWLRLLGSSWWLAARLLTLPDDFGARGHCTAFWSRSTDELNPPVWNLDLCPPFADHGPAYWGAKAQQTTESPRQRARATCRLNKRLAQLPEIRRGATYVEEKMNNLGVVHRRQWEYRGPSPLSEQMAATRLRLRWVLWLLCCLLHSTGFNVTSVPHLACHGARGCGRAWPLLPPLLHEHCPTTTVNTRCEYHPRTSSRVLRASSFPGSLQEPKSKSNDGMSGSLPVTPLCSPMAKTKPMVPAKPSTCAILQDLGCPSSWGMSIGQGCRARTRRLFG